MLNKKIKFFLLFFLFLQITQRAQDGKIELYYDDGKIKAELNYIQGVLNGFSVWYFHNGNKEKEVYYNDGKIDGTVRYFYENGLIKTEINVTNGVRDGLTKFYYPNGGLKEVKSYEKGVLIKIVEVGYDSTYAPPIEKYLGAVNQIEKRKKKKNFLCGAEQCPEPIGGMEAVQSKLVYPPKALLYGLEGKVILIATVNEKGDVVKVKVVQGLGLGCTQAAIDAVKRTKFLPAVDKGKVVESWVSLTVNFKIPKKNGKVAVNPPNEFQIPEYDELVFEKKLKTKVKKPVLQTKSTSYPEKTEVAKAEIKSQTKESPPVKKVNVSKQSSERKKQVSGSQVALHVKILSCDADVCPQPIGGIEAIEKNLEVPRKVYELKLEGNVIVLTTVDKYGNVRDTHVIKRMGHGLDEAAEVAILDTRFKPGKKNGKRVRSNIKILIPYSYKK